MVIQPPTTNGHGNCCGIGGDAIVKPVGEPRTLRVRFSDDLPSSMSYQDIDLDEASTQLKLERKRNEVAMFMKGLTTAIP
ncbi:hypothetical protein FNV43_RR00691 [Rhamnella rubrinervis]|uniref:Uncharacterized protein n=1 Tax=Rhamnella rubrinervis TaxID=2594499 RepID=A0A8K0HQ22_9ROSA|nr:hypothetical protein FNV43_RR00691 [Rhamnella rubrinervis]